MGENEWEDYASNGSDREHQVELGVVNLHVLLDLKLEGRLGIAAERAKQSKKEVKRATVNVNLLSEIDGSGEEYDQNLELSVLQQALIFLR